MDYGSFPAEPYFGQGNDSEKDHKTFYWWKKTQADVTFRKYFKSIYGADLKIGYKDISIDSGIQPKSGDDGVPSFEDFFGYADEIYYYISDGSPANWGPPVYGREDGNLSGFTFKLYRDMRDTKYLPKFWKLSRSYGRDSNIRTWR